MRGMRRLLGNSALVRLLAGEFVSSIGDWLYMVAILVVVYDVARDPLLLGLIGAVRVLPYIFLSVPAGIVADRFDRRLVLLASDVARGLLMVMLAVLVALGSPVLPILVVTILATAAATFFGPAISAYLPALVTDEADLGPANSAWATLDNLAFIIGPAVAGLLIAVGGLQAAFLLNALSFGIIAVVLLTLPSGRTEAASLADTHSPAASTEGQSASFGWRALVGMMPGPLVLDAATSLAGGGLGVLTVIIAVDLLGAGEAATGYLNAAVGVGGVVASLVAGVLTLRRLDVALVGGIVVGAIGVATLGFSRELALALVAIAVGTGALLLLDVVNVTLIQRSVPDEVRGRAMGVLQTIGTLAYAAGAFLLPVLGSLIGIPVVLLLAGLLIGLGGLLAVVFLRRTGALAAPSIDPARLTVLRASVFGDLPSARLEAAARQLTPVPVRSGQVVIRQGDRPDRFYFIESGEYGVSQADERGAVRDLRRMGPGGVFGEIGLLKAVPRTATVMAESEGSLYSLDREAFLELVQAGPGLGSRLLDMHRGVGGTPRR